ncbi:MAG: PIN domain-containing protein [Deltaproteobacteria bacterium]|jgi:predicted nucleic-acid-binding protein|nr:PIN domain-containing protein [Deltaproteobacteria bacterium]MBT4528130.1 PIN domain-containing protein [Deltaproteobacteria bacterium]
MIKQDIKINLVDTNVILRYLLADHDEFSPKATDFFKKVAKNENSAEIPAFVLAECVHVLLKFYKVPKQEFVTSLLKILSFQGVINQDHSILINALNMYQSVNIDFPDCLLAAMSTTNRKIVSFDKDFLKVPAHLDVL